MKIHYRLALILLTAGLAACGSDLGGSKGAPLTPTGAVINSNPTSAPTAANKSTVGFKVLFPEAAGVQKAALNPAMTKVTITTSGICGTFSLDLTPSNNTGVMNLMPGDCTFTASAYDSLNATIDSATTQGTLLPGPNDISLILLGGPWLFVDPATNDKSSLTLVGGEVLSGIRLQNINNTLITRWLGPDTLNDGPTADDIMGGTLTTPPQLRVTGTFTGGTGGGTNLVRLVGGMSNLETWEGNYSAGQRVVQILGVNPNATFTKTFTPTTYRDYFTSKVIDGTTIEGNIAEFTVVSQTSGTPYGSCGAVASAAAARAAAFTETLGTVRKAATTSVGSVTVNWTECLLGQNVDVIANYSNVNVHPFKAQSYFAAPASELQIKFNAGMYAYKQAISSEDLVNGTDLSLLRLMTSNLVAAADLANSTSDVSPTGDAARFFGAISRLAALGVDSESDGTANGLNNFGDLLDALGVPADSTTRNWSNLIQPPKTCVDYTYYIDCTPNLPATSPTSGEILTLLDTKLNTQLDLAIADLSNIPAGFSYNFTDPLSFAVTNFDYGDVLALTAIAHGIKAELAIDMAYDLDLDIDATINGTGPASVQAFLDANPNIGTLDATRYATELAQAKADLQTGLTKMNEAIDAIEAEGTGTTQENEFISFHKTDWECIPDQTGIPPYCTWTEVDHSAQEIANIRDGISKALTLLNATGPVTVDDNMTPSNTADDVIIDPSKFFAGISFRALLPTFTGDVPDGLFPDPTMGGILIQGANVNEDVDGNGKPDLLERPNFYPGLISGNIYNSQSWLNTGGNIFWQNVTFNSNGTLTANWDYQNYNVNPPVVLNGTATGSWQILADGSLQITVTAGTEQLNITGINLSLDYYPDAMSPGFNAKATITFADNSTMTTYSWWSKLP